jgi:hypothetical protein
MSHWEDRFTNHPAHEALADVTEQHSASTSVAQESGDRAIIDHERIGHLLRRIRDAFHSVDPIAATQGQLNSVKNNLNKALGELSNFRQNGNVRQLANANTHVENALVQTGLLPKIENYSDVESVQDAVVSFRRSVGVESLILCNSGGD